MSRSLMVLMVALGTLQWTSAAVAQRRCQSQILAQIQQAGIPPDDIVDIRISRRTQDFGDNRRVTGIDGWVRLNSCPGSFIVDMHPNCQVRQVYTRGMCQIPGVKSFLD